MPARLAAADFNQELLILFDAYVHGNLDRRGFLDKAQKFAKAGVTAAGLLAALSPDFAAGQQVPKETMTNATVADLVAAPDGRRLRLRYKDGEKIIVVPADAPVVSFRPADRSLLVPGASVSLTAQELNGQPTALRISAGRNGFPVPY